MSKYVNILTQTKDAELGYALDSRFYGTGDYNEFMKKELASLTLQDVNNAIRKYFGVERQDARRDDNQRRRIFTRRDFEQ